MKFLLTSLYLEHFDATLTQVTDETCLYLAAHTNLKEIDLSGTNVTGKNFAAWGKLTELKTLKLDDTPITDETVGKLPFLPKLDHISLNNCETLKRVPRLFFHRFPALTTYCGHGVVWEDWKELVKTHPGIRQVQ